MNNLDANSKFCKTCSELSPAELDKCQFCGSELKDVLDEVNSDLNLKISIGSVSSEIENEEPNISEILPYDNVESYVKEAYDEKENSINNDQAQFNDIFGFKSSNGVQEKIVKEIVKDDSISNKKKVFLTVICAIVPGFGQLFCLILSIIFMNSEDNEDRKSFGSALFAAALILFVLTCIISFLIALVVYQPPM